MKNKKMRMWPVIAKVVSPVNICSMDKRMIGNF